MGRTVPTFTMVIHEQESHWRKFREALRREDQEVFDELFRAPKIHLAACAYAVNPIPFENIIMSMLLEERKRTIAIENRLGELMERLKIKTANEIEDDNVSSDRSGRQPQGQGMAV